MRHRFPRRLIACAGVMLLGVAWRRCVLVVGASRVREKPGALVGVPGFVVERGVLAWVKPAVFGFADA
jgi:hypothetical protein